MEKHKLIQKMPNPIEKAGFISKITFSWLLNISSKSKKLRQIKQKRHYLNVIKNDLPISKYPHIITMLDSINRIFKKYGQRSILIK